MTAILEAFVGSPELQTVLVGAVVWCIVWLLKATKVFPADGGDLQKRITALVAAVLLAGAQEWLLWLTVADPVNWGQLVLTAVLAWAGATGGHVALKTLRQLLAKT